MYLKHLREKTSSGHKEDVTVLTKKRNLVFIKSNEYKVQPSKLHLCLLRKLFLSSTELKVVNNSESANDTSD